MSVIDIHAHAFPEKIAGAAVSKLAERCHTRPFTDGTQAGLTASMTAAGIGVSVLQPVATNPRQVPHVNDAAIGTNGREGLLSFGCMHPDFEGWGEELGRIAASGLKGIKLHPVYAGVDIDDPRYLRILERAGELGLVTLVHAGWDIGFPGGPQALPRKMRTALGVAGPMILAHMGGWRCWDEAAELLAGAPNAHIDTAFSLGVLTPLGDGYEQDLRLLDEENFLRLMRAWGVGRVLFGTDTPWADQAESLRAIRALPLTEAEREAILYGNAARLLGLALPAA